MSRSLRRGFSLIELLVVISIISALVALLLPALSKARDAAMAVKCLSNVRQIGMASLIYSQEHRGYLLDYSTSSRIVFGGKNGHTPGAKARHFDSVWERLGGDFDVLDCPMQTTRRHHVAGVGQPIEPYPDRPFQHGYAMNMRTWSIKHSSFTWEAQLLKLQHFDDPAQKVYWADAAISAKLFSWQNGTDPPSETWVPVFDNHGSWNHGRGPSARHGGGYRDAAIAGTEILINGGPNIAYMDGHGGFSRLADIWPETRTDSNLWEHWTPSGEGEYGPANP